MIFRRILIIPGIVISLGGWCQKDYKLTIEKLKKIIPKAMIDENIHGASIAMVIYIVAGMEELN